MDVVRQSIEKIGGSVSVDSKEGEGTNFIIKIPLSLAIIDGIEVSVGKSVFTIPTNSIKKFIKLKPNQLFYDTSQNELIKDGNKTYQLIRLHQFYNITPDSDNIYDGVVVLVESEGRSACILVDELIGEQQVVVKPFSPMLNRYNIKQQGMAGCTILGDGSITIILDIGSIINEN
jgi:two-component system chemotaxis sensor kinase CheA